MKKLAIFIAPVASLVFLVGCGPSNNTAVPAPTAPETVHVEKRVEVEVEVTPQACEDFIRHADRLVQIEAQIISLAGDGFTAMSEGDFEKLNEVTEEIEKMADKIGPAKQKYEASRYECQTA